ncbi:MAG: thioredoxin family protein [Planctomycetota bacterium]
MLKSKNLFALIALGTASSLFAAPALAQAQPTTPPKETPKETPKKDETKKDVKKDEKKDAKKVAAATVGSVAPTFVLNDTDGKEHKLADLTKDGKIVVLFWFNSECPYVVKHFNESKTFNDLAAKYKDKKVVVMAVNSNAADSQGSGLETNKKVKKDWSMDYPILLDATGATGKAYGAKNTPATYVIAADGTLAYAGAIDDDSGDQKPGKTNYAAKAVDELLAGKKVTTSTTKPYGCGVKYSK